MYLSPLSGFSIEEIHFALAEEIPDAGMRVRALLRWYGTGAGHWYYNYTFPEAGCRPYECFALDLLVGIEAIAIWPVGERCVVRVPRL